MATVATADGHPYVKWENKIKFSQFDNIDLSDTSNNIRLGWSLDKWYAEIGKQNDGEEVTEFGVKFKNMGGISGLTLKTKIESEKKQLLKKTKMCRMNVSTNQMRVIK